MKSVILASVFCILIAGCGGQSPSDKANSGLSNMNAGFSKALCSLAQATEQAAIINNKSAILQKAINEEAKYC